MDDREQTIKPGSNEGAEAVEPVEPIDETPRPAADIGASASPPIVDGREHGVDPRSVKIARIIAIPLTLLIGILPIAFITLGWALGGIPVVVYLPLLTGLLTILGLVLTISYRWPAARHRHLRYQVESSGVRIRRGVFWRRVIWIPISRVQHTDVSQGPLQRKLGLAKLTVYTAGTEAASIPLAGLEHDIATRLSEHLRPDRDSDAV